MSSTDVCYNTFSLDHQDEFVLRVFNEMKPGYTGTFLDVGCLHGIHGNNTFTLENAGWAGYLISEHELFTNENTKIRGAPCILADLSNCDWTAVLPAGLHAVDYVSLVPADEKRFQSTLVNFPWKTLRFTICTVRHFHDRHGPENRDFARKFFEENGYKLLAGDVCSHNDLTPYEDWYVDPATFSMNFFEKYNCNSVRGIEVFCRPKVLSSQRFATCSSDLQDEFVMRLLNDKNPAFCGTFLDIGCGHGYKGNNTFLLEARGWKGYLVDIDAEAYEWNVKNRDSSKSVCTDVTTCDWNEILGKKSEEMRVFDYISFDVDEATMDALRNFPWDTVRFRVMTIEHDMYRFGPMARNCIRILMEEQGYTLVCADVCAGFNNGPFEDWYVDASLVEGFEPYISNHCRATDILYTVKV